MYVVIQKQYHEVYGPFSTELMAQTWIEDVCSEPSLWEVRILRDPRRV